MSNFFYLLCWYAWITFRSGRISMLYRKLQIHIHKSRRGHTLTKFLCTTCSTAVWFSSSLVNRVIALGYEVAYWYQKHENSTNYRWSNTSQLTDSWFNCPFFGVTLIQSYENHSIFDCTLMLLIKIYCCSVQVIQVVHWLIDIMTPPSELEFYIFIDNTISRCMYYNFKQLPGRREEDIE